MKVIQSIFKFLKHLLLFILFLIISPFLITRHIIRVKRYKHAFSKELKKFNLRKEDIKDLTMMSTKVVNLSEIMNNGKTLSIG